MVKEKIINYYNPFIEKYFEAIKKGNIKDEQLKGIPSIHIPIVSEYYDNAKIKIMIYGKETNYWDWKNKEAGKNYFRDMLEFKNKYNFNYENAYKYLSDPFTSMSYIDTINGYSSFFDYVMHFLKRIYCLPLSANLKNENREIKQIYADIFKSFLWGNINALEQYRINKVIEKDVYKKLKDKAGEIIGDKFTYGDHMSNILEICKPDILLILNWERDFIVQNWLKKYLGNDYNDENKEKKGYFYYYHIKKEAKNIDTYFYKIGHPNIIYENDGSFSKSLDSIIDHLKKSLPKNI